MTFSRRHLAVYLVKLVLAGGLVYWLYRSGSIDMGLLARTRPTPRNLALGAGAVLCMVGVACLIALRLRILLHYSRFAVAYHDILYITLVSSLFGVLLPGLVGGDAIKAGYLCSRVVERRSNALATVVFDRIVGLYGLVMVSALALLAVGLTGRACLPSEAYWIAPAMLAAGALGALVFSNRRILQSPPMAKLLRLLPCPAQDFLKTIKTFVGAPRLLLLSVCLSTLSHALAVCAFVLLAQVVEDPLSPMLHFVLNPLAMLMNAVPLTPGGLGLTESAFAYLFSLVGSLNGALVGLMGRLAQYLVYIVGGLISLLLLRWEGFRIESLQAGAVTDGWSSPRPTRFGHDGQARPAGASSEC
jgi:uncharacterized membrane protein YbhN (UPF0104 family)